MARPTPLNPWPTAGTLDAYVRAEQVRVVFQQAPPGQLLSIAGAGVICYVLWRVADHRGLLGWFALLTAAALCRMSLAILYARRKPPIPAVPAWELAFVATLAGVSLIWGLGGWLIMPTNSPVHQAIVYFFIMGVAGGAVASYSALPAASVTAVLALMLPATLGIAIEGGTELRAMAAGGALYVAAALRSTLSVGAALRRNFELSFELQEAYGRAKDLARTDELTGLPNRRAFLERGATALELARRHGRALSVILFDLDYFKRINDTYGHAGGDAALRTVTGVLRRVARASDTPGRLGGEEFGLLLPETVAGDAVGVAERLRRDIAAAAVSFNGMDIGLTCSFGVAQVTGVMSRLDELLRTADEALYRAKDEGRNRVVSQ